jgi:hypothetical protein
LSENLSGAETSREFYGKEKAVKLPVFHLLFSLDWRPRGRDATGGMPA